MARCESCGQEAAEHEDGFDYCRVCGTRIGGDQITTSASVQNEPEV